MANIYLFSFSFFFFFLSYFLLLQITSNLKPIITITRLFIFLTTNTTKKKLFTRNLIVFSQWIIYDLFIYLILFLFLLRRSNSLKVEKHWILLDLDLVIFYTYISHSEEEKPFDKYINMYNDELFLSESMTFFSCFFLYYI